MTASFSSSTSSGTHSASVISIFLAILIIATAETTPENDVPDAIVVDPSSSKEPKYEPAARGGFRWRDLGVSFEPCQMDTSTMRRKYTSDAATTATADGDECDEVCLDDSLWLLYPTSGFVEDGSLCGIIGPSGSGKTTFLSALGGTMRKNSGIYLTGSAWYEEAIVNKSSVNLDATNYENDFASGDGDSKTASTTINARGKKYRRYHLSQQGGDIAMLSQHDNFFGMLTPRESIEFAAFLEIQKRSFERNDGGYNGGANHKEVAHNILASLGLLGVADRRIGDRTKLDGGDEGNSRVHIKWDDLRFWPGSRRRRPFSNSKCNSGVRTESAVRKVTDGVMTRKGGGLSGGERRRLSVAMELITEPKIFLADEPTTGLDSAQAEKVVALIAKLAKDRQVPSICTLHQPKTSIWNLLDTFILLAPGGKMCYAGDRSGATEYFKNIGYECPPETNPAEYFIDLVSIDTEDPVKAAADTERIDFLHHQFLDSCTATILSYDDVEMWTPPESGSASRMNKYISTNVSFSSKIRKEMTRISNTINRFASLLQRSLRQNIRNTSVNVLRFGCSAMQAVLFAAIFKSVRDDKPLTKSIADRVALLTYAVVNMSIMSLMKTLDLFARERFVVTREQMRHNYYGFEYLLAKVVSEMPLDTAYVLVHGAILKQLTGLRTSLATLMKTLSLMTVSSVSLGFAIGSLTSSVDTAMSTGVPIMVIFMILGVINPSGVNLDDPPMPIMELLKIASPIKWAIESLVVAEFRDMAFGEKERGLWGNLKDLPRMGALAMVRNGNEVLENLGLGNAKYSQLMKNLGILSCVYLSMSWLGLAFGGPKFIDIAASS
mmetsp:Transcript_13566/g.25847  ORF Transcript_13566/g.25847 Transcript_13566/m.25847 type:complete len:835 (-) Transcript_13566:198-2702(-)